MFIPNSIPTTLAEMRDFLLPMVDTGFFESVEYDDPDTPTKLICTQDADVILEISASRSVDTYWTFIPYVAGGVPADSNHQFDANGTGALLIGAYRCTGGAGLHFYNSSGYYHYFIIARSTLQRTAFLIERTSETFLGDYWNCHPICYGDDTSLSIYTNGYRIFSNALDDRTILREIPIAGSRGSMDGFSSAFVRDMVQFVETGEQIIGGTKYFCLGPFAILDE